MHGLPLSSRVPPPQPTHTHTRNHTPTPRPRPCPPPQKKRNNNKTHTHSSPAPAPQGEELEPARQKAEAAGVKEIYIDDLREEFVRDFVWPMFRCAQRCVATCVGQVCRHADVTTSGVWPMCRSGMNTCAATMDSLPGCRHAACWRLWTAFPAMPHLCLPLPCLPHPVQGQLAVRGRVPAGHLHRAPAHRQAADRDRSRGGRRRCEPRRHRQGQRPSAVRAGVRRWARWALWVRWAGFAGGWAGCARCAASWGEAPGVLGLLCWGEAQGGAG